MNKNRTLKLEYGPKLVSLFLILSLALTSASSIVAAPVRASSNPKPDPTWDAPRIRLSIGEFDPLVVPEPAGLPDLLRLSAYPGDGRGYYLVQFQGPIALSDVDALTMVGAGVFDYIPDFTFIVKMDSAMRAAVEKMEQVRWVGLYQPAYRLATDLLAYTFDDTPVSDPSRLDDGRQTADPKALWGDNPIEVVVSIFRGEELPPIRTQVETLGGVIRDQSQTKWKSKLLVSISPSLLTDLAAFSGVRWIEKAPEWKLTNSEAADIMGVREVWDTHGLYGAGQTIAVCDSGLDQGSTSPASLHDDFENGSGASRVLVVHDVAGDGAPSDVNSGHGTHVAGSVLGNGDLSGATPGTHTYPSTAYVGMAPEASLVFQATEDNAAGGLVLPADLNTLFAQAASSGADLHTNSWGASVASMYTGNSEEVDQYVWDHKNFTILFSAGNEGVDSDADGVIDRYSMGSPSSAKNCITVGATENDRPSGSTPTPGYDFPWGTGWAVEFPVDPINSDHVSDDPDGMAAFSSRGPTLDGRVKPDLVGPGTNIASTRSSLISGDGWGPIDSNYMFMGGTSMSTPLVAGVATLVRQYYTDEESITPSAALIKATLVNGTTDIAPGQYGTGATQEIPYGRPTNVAGWGRVNLENSIFPAAPRNMLYEDETTGLTTGGSDTFSYTVSSSAEPLHVTLAWSDYPGSPAAAGGLVNDLDLTIIGPGGTYYPNNASQRGASQHLTYDDGVANGYYTWGAGIRNAVRFTPTSYPATLQTGLFFVGSESSTYPKTFNWYVYDGNGTTGPGTVLASGSTTIRRVGWHPVDLSGEGVTIASGDFFLAIELPDSDLAWLYDASSPIDGRSWDYDGSWANWTTNDYMFNAVVASADASTNQDRVNNLVGIDINSPPTGDYVITVSGYNVPQGPQPYALVTSGAVTRSGGANTAPTISGLPDQTLPMNGSLDNAIDLWAYAADAEDADANLTFSFDRPPAGNAGVSIDSNRYIDINPPPGWVGQVIVNIRVTDSGGLWSTDSFDVDIYADKIWDGSIDIDWHTAYNWTPSGVPTSGDNVVIPDEANDPIISSSDAAVNSLSIESGAVLDLTDRTLTVEGTLTNNGTLKQTLGVSGGSTSEFLRITNLAGDQTKYYGVDITPSVASDATPDIVTTWGTSSIRQDSSALARRVTLSLDSLPDYPLEGANEPAAPRSPQAVVDLVLDDGSIEGAAGVNNSTNSAQFLWLNRFTPDPSEFPFTLDEIWALFYDFGNSDNIAVGDDIDLVVYEDADGDPSNGATWLATFNETVQAVDGVTWNVYTLTTPVTLTGPGDVLIAAINRFVVSGVSPIAYPASYDSNSPQSRSWLGWYNTNPPDPPDPAILPPTASFSVFDDRNFTIRGYGSTIVTNTAPTISGLPDQTLPVNGSVDNAIDLWAYASDAEDADGVMTYTISNSPVVSAGVTVDANRYIDINPATDWTGTTDVEVQVQDTGGLTDTDTFQVMVSDVPNTPPTITGLPDQQVPTNGSVDNAIDLWAYASDVEDADGVMTYTIGNSPVVSAGVSISVNRYIDITPATDWTGVTDVEIQVQDTGGLTDTDTFQVTVTDTGVITNVTVSVSGNQFCAGRATGVERCFDITPAAALDATVRFYLSEAERNGLTLGDLLVFRYDGDWIEEPGPYTSGGTGDAQYVEAQNIDEFSLFALDQVVEGTIYLPIVMRNYPPLPATPTLNTISNSDSDGNYTVSWNPAEWADTYTLQEDDNAAFSSPTTRYAGSDTSWNATGKGAGTYYYRVRASNSMGDSGWSNVQSVSVGPPDVPVLNAISNPDGNGSYTVSWNVTNGAQTYALQEDDNAAFSSPTTVYSGSDTSWDASGNDLGTYYYRVQALNGFGSSAWSNTESVEVTVGITPQDGDWTGTNDQGRSLSFSVSSNGTLIPQFTINVGFDGACGVSYTTNYFYDIPITDNAFAATSSQNEVTGAFTGDTTASGTYEIVIEIVYPSYCTATRTGTWTASTP